MLLRSGDFAMVRATTFGAYWGPRVLGAFVVWQLVFIPAANLLDFFPHRELSRDEVTDFREQPAEALPATPVVDVLAGVTDRWAQATGQYQMWWLFAPTFPPQATFATTELQWADRPSVKLASVFDPPNPQSYARLPGSDDRLFQYEVHLGLGLVYWDRAAATTDEEAWREHFRTLVARQWKSMRAYLRWRVEEYRDEHPGEPLPSEVVLSMRIYRTSRPGESSNVAAGVIEQPVARWFPALDDSPDRLPVEAYDPFAKQFVRLPRERRGGTERIDEESQLARSIGQSADPSARSQP